MGNGGENKVLREVCCGNNYAFVSGSDGNCIFDVDEVEDFGESCNIPDSPETKHFLEFAALQPRNLSASAITGEGVE